MIDFEKALNAEQLAAATAPDGPLLVLAAAGTGKTRTLVYRVAYLVHGGISAENILLLTFTNRAAREMLERATSVVGSAVGGLWGGTFHHMANRILRRHAALLGYRPDYTILDRDDAEALIGHAVKDHNLQGREFPKPEVLISVFSATANTGTPLDELAERRFAHLPVAPEDIRRVHRSYEARKRQSGAMDFDDLLVNCRRLFDEHPEVLGSYQERFRHVLVDEYQDTNALQARLVDQVAGRHGNLLVVGDDFQSIYSWRGADFRNIMSFPTRYPAARIFKLETNYRSAPEILNVANAVIAGNPEQFQKTLRATRPPHRKPAVVHARDGRGQAAYATHAIRRFLREGHAPSEIAVLYRAHFHSMELQMELTREGIPFVITSGVRFFEQAHVKDVCCLPRILDNPQDELAFARLLGMLPGVGPRTVQKLWEGLGSRLPDAQASRRAIGSRLRDAARAVWERIAPILDAYRTEELAGKPGEVIARFVDAFYEEYAEETYENADVRMDDIRELIAYSSRYESTREFLADIALLTNMDAEGERSGEGEKPSVRLSTVHQAKGLEWAVVIVLWASEGMFPSSRAVEETTDGLAEERRLFYVAVTRAKDELFLCTPEVRRTRDGGVFYAQPSRFVTELPQGLVRHEYAGD